MQSVIPAATVLNLVLPIALLWWLFKTRAKSRVYFASIVVLLAVYLAVARGRSIFAFWHVVGSFWPTVFLIAFAVILIYRLRRGLPVAWLPRKWSLEFFLTGPIVLYAAYLATAISSLSQARAFTGEPLRLAPPLRDGTYTVRSGGANFFVNQHAADPAVEYALDIHKVNAFGLRAAGFFPAELSKYAVFGAEIVAPCAGEVIATENSAPNRAPLDPDSTDRGGGNHVVLYCDGHSVHLAHMDTGTVAVAVGDRVPAGQFLGRVGNSGNSLEPHLHISAVVGRRARFRDPSSEPVKATPILIDGRFLITGDSFTN
jgi:murein DD-endopeptidase MepM/ murein hydrolase activator NlpD